NRVDLNTPHHRSHCAAVATAVTIFTRTYLPHRRVTFSTANQAQDLQDASQHSYYDSGLEESETPSSKSSSGPRIGPLALPEDHYERTTPDGSIGEMEHPENDDRSADLCVRQSDEEERPQTHTHTLTHSVSPAAVARICGSNHIVCQRESEQTRRAAQTCFCCDFSN
ncbi:hypothetical protein JOB18_045607, partial [Solea senegalensis]